MKITAEINRESMTLLIEHNGVKIERKWKTKGVQGFKVCESADKIEDLFNDLDENDDYDIVDAIESVENSFTDLMDVLD